MLQPGWLTAILEVIVSQFYIVMVLVNTPFKHLMIVWLCIEWYRISYTVNPNNVMRRIIPVNGRWQKKCNLNDIAFSLSSSLSVSLSLSRVLSLSPSLLSSRLYKSTVLLLLSFFLFFLYHSLAHSSTAFNFRKQQLVQNHRLKKQFLQNSAIAKD